jgi:hypothetical protein
MAGPDTSVQAAAAAAAAPPAPGAAGAAPAPAAPAAPLAAAAQAIDAAHRRLEEALAALAAGDGEHAGRALERATGCADHVARALWFLRRAARERAGADGA